MRRMLAAVLASIVAACAQQPPAPPPAAEMPPGFSDAYYRQAAAQGTPVLRIDPAASLVAIEVYRGGSLARLGHDHVVASHDVRGFVAPERKTGRPVLPARQPRRRRACIAQGSGVRHPAHRRRHRGNASQHVDCDGSGGIPVRDRPRHGRRGARRTGDARHRLRARRRADRAGAGRARNAAGSLVAKGRVALKQTDFGITPLSVLGGAIQVKDEVRVRFVIRAGALE